MPSRDCAGRLLGQYQSHVGHFVLLMGQECLVYFAYSSMSKLLISEVVNTNNFLSCYLGSTIGIPCGALQSSPIMNSLY